MPTTMARWKLFFLFFGSFSFAFGIAMIFLMPDNQNNARWLTSREKKIAIERLRANQNVSADHTWKWSQFWEALRDPQVWAFLVMAM